MSDKIFDTGTQAFFLQLSDKAVQRFAMESRKVTEDPFKITYGHSEDHRPDLRQFLIFMLFVDRNIPMVGAAKNGNASDKTLADDWTDLGTMAELAPPNKRPAAMYRTYKTTVHLYNRDERRRLFLWCFASKDLLFF